MKLLALIFLSLMSFSHAKKVEYFVIDRVAEPFQIYDSKNGHSGIITDVISKTLGMDKVEPVVYPFARMENEMKTKPSRNWVNYGAKVWGNPQSDNLSSTAVLNVQHVFLTNKEFKYNSIEDLFGKRIVLIRGFVYPGLQKYIEMRKIKVVYVDSYQSVLKALEVGRAVAFPGMKKRILYHIKKSKFHAKNFSFYDISSLIENYSIHLAFNIRFPSELKSSIDEKLKSLKESGELLKIIQKYTQE